MVLPVSVALALRVNTLPEGYPKLPAVFGQFRGCAVARLPPSCLPYYPPAVLPRIRITSICTRRTQRARLSSITFRRNADQFQGVRTSLITSLQTVTVVRTVTSATQTLFTTTCAQDPDTITTPTTIVITTTPSETEPVTVTRTPTETTSSSSSTSSYVVAPVTLTSTFTSTDPSGNIIIATVATVSTPSPDSAQSGSGGGSPNTTAIIGGVVGGVVGLLALIGIIWFIMYKRLSGGQWDETWEEDEGHQAGAAEVKPGGSAAANDGSSPNPYVYGVVGRGTPSPLLRGDQASGMHSHSRSTSTATGYADHGRSNSQTPLMLATSPPHSPPNSPPSLPQHLLPGLERRGTPVWASASAQQGYFHQGYPPISPDPNFTQMASSAHGVFSGYPPPPHTAANQAMAYPPGAAPPVIGGPSSTFNEYHKPPLEQSQYGAARQPSQRQQTGPSGNTTKLVDDPMDNSADSLLKAAGLISGHTPSMKDQKFDKGGLQGAPTSQIEPSRKTSLISVASAAPKATNHPRIAEEAPPAYQQ